MPMRETSFHNHTNSATVPKRGLWPQGKLAAGLKGALLGILVLSFLTLAFRWLFPVWVGITPISRFSLWNKLEETYGQQTLEDMLNEKLLAKEFAKNKIKVDETAADAQLQLLEEQFKNVGGLDIKLAKRGMTKEDMKKQIIMQLSVEQLLKDKIEPTDEEIRDDYESNKDSTYQNHSFEEVAEDIKKKIRASRLSDELTKWMGEAKSSKAIINFGI